MKSRRKIKTLEEAVPLGTDPAWFKMRVALKETEPDVATMEQGIIHLVRGLRACALANTDFNSEYDRIAAGILWIIDQVLVDEGNLGRLDRDVLAKWLREFQEKIA